MSRSGASLLFAGTLVLALTKLRWLRLCYVDHTARRSTATASVRRASTTCPVHVLEERPSLQLPPRVHFGRDIVKSVGSADTTTIMSFQNASIIIIISRLPVHVPYGFPTSQIDFRLLLWN